LRKWKIEIEARRLRGRSFTWRRVVARILCRESLGSFDTHEKLRARHELPLPATKSTSSIRPGADTPPPTVARASGGRGYTQRLLRHVLAIFRARGGMALFLERNSRLYGVRCIRFARARERSRPHGDLPQPCASLAPGYITRLAFDHRRES